jgi:hypothetical protein
VDDRAAAAHSHPAPHEYLNCSNARRLNSILDRNRTHLNTQAKAERDSYMVFQTQDSNLPGGASIEFKLLTTMQVEYQLKTNDMKKCWPVIIILKSLKFC